jgi:hypothetical protein
MARQKGKRHARNLDGVSNADISAAIDMWIHNERNRAIMKRRLIDGICFEPLAEEFDLSVCQVKNIVYKNEPVILLKLPIDK